MCIRDRCKGAWVLCQLLLDGGGLAVLTGVQLLHRGDCGAAEANLRAVTAGLDHDGVILIMYMLLIS